MTAMIAFGSVTASLGLLFIGSFGFMFCRELLEEKREEREGPVLGWTGEFEDTLELMLLQQKQDSRICPEDQGGCGGARCWDWRRNGRVCGDNPTRAEETGYLLGNYARHAKPYRVMSPYTAPLTQFGREHRDLWRKVSDHVAIPLHRPRQVKLP